MAIQDFPENALGIYDEPTWAETPVATPDNTTPVAPSAGVAAAGLGNVALAWGLFNYLFRQPYRWIRAFAHRFHRSDTGLIGTYRVTGGTYAATGLTLSVQLPLTEVWINGVFVQAADSLATPHVFTASRDSYLFLDADGVRTETEVPNGDPAPVAAGTQVYISKTVTDAIGVTSSVLNPLLSSTITLGTVDIAALGVVGNLEVAGTLLVSGATTLSAGLDMDGSSITNTDAIASATVATTGNVSVGGNLDMTTGSISNVTTIAASSSATTILGASSNATAAAVAGANSSTGIGVLGTSIGSLPSVWGINSGSGQGVKGSGGSAGAGVEGLATATLVPGVLGTGAAAAGSNGVTGVAVNTASYGVSGTTAAAATTSAAGVRADALGDGVALSAVAVNGNAGRFESDTTTPTRAPVVIVGQDADASTAQAGSLAFNTTRAKWRIHTGSQYESLHSSPKGHLFGVSSVSTSSNTTTSGDIGDITITPEQTGTVIITLTGSWCAPSADDDTTMTVILKDITGAATVLTSQPFMTIDRDAEVGLTRHMPFVVRAPYTLPSTGSRLFRYRLDFGGNVSAVNWYDTFMTIEGVY